MCVTPCAPRRARYPSCDSAGLDSTSEPFPEKCAEQNLETTVATDVVKGPPDDVGARMLASLDSPCEAGQAVTEHLRPACRAGGEKHPFGLAARALCLRRGLNGRSASHPQGHVENAGVLGTAIGNDGVDGGGLDDPREVFARYVRRANHQASSDAVELDQRNSRRKRILSREQDGEASEIGQTAAKARASQNVTQADDARNSLETSCRTVCRPANPVLERVHEIRRPFRRTE